MYDPRLARLADVLVNYSTSVKKGDLVRLTAPVFGKPFLVELYQAVLRAGGHPRVEMPPAECSEVMLRTASNAQLRYQDPIERFTADRIDVSIYLDTLQDAKPLGGIDPAKQTLVDATREKLLARLEKRAAAGKLRRVTVLLPSQADSKHAKMSPTAYEQFVFDAGHLYTDNPCNAWREVSRRQQTAIEYLAGVNQLHLTTPEGTDLKVGVAGRQWVNGDGHHTFPDGEVFTVPLEDATEGTVCFSFPAVCEGHEVKEISLTFKKGRVVKASAAAGEEFLLKMLDRDTHARSLGKIAFGTNYAIRQHIGNFNFDRKIGGTFHLTLGSNESEAGNAARAKTSSTMVCDLRHGGRVTADDELILENGDFVKPGWPKM